jgi:hypothetical protein
MQRPSVPSPDVIISSALSLQGDKFIHKSGNHHIAEEVIALSTASVV